MKLCNPFLILIISVLFFCSCHKEKYGSIELHFTHTIDTSPITYNQLIYKNKAGNQYQINEVKYFISKMILLDESGKSFEIKQENNIHYVDNSIKKTLRWKLIDIPQNHYSSISFVFGLDENENVSNRFVNPPESNFSWPKVLGGGYHYMQLNGKFINKNGEIQNMNIHTGIGQIYNENNETTQFIHNYFMVNLPVDFYVEKNKATVLTLNMEIQRWFDTPNLYNFDEFGTGIMQNQYAQKLLKENGKNVFEMKID